jgi:glycosyltransferase involved in cell wall biosynthesis
VGGALFGLLTSRPVIFHSHEIPRGRLERMLFAVTASCSTTVVCVSEAHAAQLPLPRSHACRVVIVPNALDPEFTRLAARTPRTGRSEGRFRVLYATSALSPQKGLPQFFRLAEALRYRDDIELLLAAPRHEAAALPAAIPANVSVHFGEATLAPLYAAADVLLNLSPPDLSVETFGLTILEAMAFGTPAVVPPVGGPADLVREGKEGYHVDAHDTGRLVEVLTRLASDGDLWLRLSSAARKRAGDFSFAAYARRLGDVLDVVLRVH